MSSFYEIHELPTGEIILKRSDDEDGSEPLVSIRFSAESLGFLGDARFRVAKAMIEAGMEAAGELAEQLPDETDGEQLELDHMILH
jgi:hypothetical protein